MDKFAMLPSGQPGVSLLPPAGEGPWLVARCSRLAAGHRIKTHRHARGQLMWVAAGSLFVRTERCAWLLPPSRALWVPAGADHAIVAHGEVQLRTLYLRADGAQALPDACAVLEVTALLQALILRLTASEPQAPPLRMDLALPLLIAEIAQLPACPLALPLPADPAMRAYCDRILADDAPGDRAPPVGVHAKALYRRFLAETGLSHTQWRRQALLLQAVRRLSAGEPVTQVALDLGYESPAAFSTMFKRQLGCTPRSFLPDALGGRVSIRKSRA
ncbi:AraC family transcriptional regulator [Ideonella sp.]|uniref:AraC family transcriptional regulator n=1 Tax=Ideonella sp. TaxID=1929293 RepID=UPI003BB702EF